MCVSVKPHMHGTFSLHELHNMCVSIKPHIHGILSLYELHSMCVCVCKATCAWYIQSTQTPPHRHGIFSLHELHSLCVCKATCAWYWAVQVGLLTPLTFARHHLSPLAAFYFPCILSSLWKAVTVNLHILHCQL